MNHYHFIDAEPLAQGVKQLPQSQVATEPDSWEASEASLPAEPAGLPGIRC